jgi:beta-1,4-mannosyl-glycoprotein beta-1,4-N-acetylglucosaminyltransferase
MDPQPPFSLHYNHYLPVEKRCESMNWTVGGEKRLVSLLHFNTELDLLLLRLLSQNGIVDRWIISESNYTYSGLVKPLYLSQIMEDWKRRWNVSWEKVHLLTFVPDETYIIPAKTTQEAWKNEKQQRDFLYESAKEHLKPGDVILTSDTDEIPDPNLLELFKRCKGWPDPMHLWLETSMYSFEFPMQTMSEGWNSNVQLYQGGFSPAPKRFGKVGQYAVAQAGWHCSFCLRTLEQMQQKISAYSHFDRMTSRSALSREWIQKRACLGESLFDQVWEEYEWRSWARNSLFRGVVPRMGLKGVPLFVIEMSHALNLGYLLPGGCMRI